jgi:uncharacterized Tic20 family protein
MKKLIVPALVSAVAMLAAGIIIGYSFNFLFPSVTAEYENAALYRAWDDPLMYLFFLQPFILSALLVWGWEKIKSHFQGSIGRKAFNVSLTMLLLSIIPGMLMTISSFKVSPLAILTWTISAFIQVLVASLVFIRMSK